MACGRGGRRLRLAYTGNPQSRPVYRCDKPNLMMGLPRCMTFGGPRIDSAIAKELLRAVEPMAIGSRIQGGTDASRTTGRTTANPGSGTAAGAVRGEFGRAPV